MPNRHAVFTCPECDHEDDYVDFYEPVNGTERGSYDVDGNRHDYDGDTDLERNGDRTYACRECGEEIDFEELQSHVSRQPERAVAELSISQDSSAEENESSNSTRIVDLKSDATCDAISSTQTCVCLACGTLILGKGGKSKFVVCTNCSFEFDKTSLNNLTPALQ